MAALKVEAARAQFNVTDADRYHQLNASSGITYNGGLKGDKPTTQEYDAGLELSYELDFFGKLKNMSEADRQNQRRSPSCRTHPAGLLRFTELFQPATGVRTTPYCAGNAEKL